MKQRQVAIIGFGFAGAMVAANLVRAAAAPMIMYLIAEELNALGVAYGTTNPEHLLNVPAEKMSAFADAPAHFYEWLQANHRSIGPTDFAPRMVYGQYLQSIWQETQRIAAEKNIALKHVPTIATAITKHGEEMAVLTERGDAIAVEEVVLATGNENKPIAVPAGTPIIQNPWDAAAMNAAANLASPVMLIGTGLTAVDMLLSLRREGYTGEIIAGSLRGLWPQAHMPLRSIFTFDEAELFAQKTLRQLLRLVRSNIAQHEASGGNWRGVIDALRPHSQALWLRASTADQQRFMRHVMTYWSTHRHRMAPQIAKRITEERTAGTLHSLPRSKLQAAMQTANPSRVFNCTGPQINPQKSSYGLWKQLFASGMVELHANGMGVAADAHYCAWGNLHPHLHVIGTMMTGQWLESTAVPELRVQAEIIGENLAKNEIIQEA